MKIFLCSKSCWNIYNFRKNLIKKIIKEKHKVYILCKADSYKSKLVKLGCTFFDINYNNRNYNLINDFIIFIKIIYLNIKITPNLFLNFNVKPIIIGSLVCKIFKLNSINTITGLGSGFLRGNFFKFIFLQIYKSCLSKNCTVFFHNSIDKNLFLKKKIIKKKQSFVVPGSGVDINYFRYKKKKIEKITKLIFIGRMLWDKGIKEYIEASKILQNRKDIIFKILGDFADNENEGITKQNLHLHLNKTNIIYNSTSKNVRPFIQWADCVVLPSYREGAPKVFLEASAMGRVLIGSNVPGINHLIKDNYNGYLCGNKNPISLSKCILKYVELNKKKKEKMSKNSFRLALNNFNEELVIQIYLKKIKCLEK